MEGEEEEEDLVVGHFETGRTTVTVRDIAVSEKQPLCHRGRVARRWRAIARILFPDHQTVVRRRRRRDGQILDLLGFAAGKNDWLRVNQYLLYCGTCRHRQIATKPTH